LSIRFPHRDASEAVAPETTERQQAIALDALRAAGGEPVSYAQLRDAGVEFPASVVAELELAGVEIERCRGGVRGVPGAQLRAGDVRSPQSSAASGARTTSSQGRRLVWAALGAGAVAALALVIVALAGAGAGGTSKRTYALSAGAGAHGRHPARSGRGGTRAKPAGPRAAPTISASPPFAPGEGAGARATPVSATLAAQLETRGHELLQDERSDEAIPVLRSALQATGETLDACAQPASEVCLTYAYALYDLGRALLRSGRAAAAVGVLELRLQIENQRPVVAAELESARRVLG